MKEIWKDIAGYEGLYQVSNFGNVMSLNYRRMGYSKLLTPKCNNSGRLWVELANNGKTAPLQIHRLVAVAFIPNPNNLPQVNHKDENPKNNKVDNLEWCTGEYNIRYYYERHPDHWRKRIDRDVKLDKPVLQYSKDGTECIAEWVSIYEVYRINDWKTSSIRECCEGKRKTAYGFKWRYAN